MPGSSRGSYKAKAVIKSSEGTGGGGLGVGGGVRWTTAEKRGEARTIEGRRGKKIVGCITNVRLKPLLDVIRLTSVRGAK